MCLRASLLLDPLTMNDGIVNLKTIYTTKETEVINDEWTGVLTKELTAWLMKLGDDAIQESEQSPRLN